MNINIPFTPELAKKVDQGLKTQTVRNKRYGECGDKFWVKGRTYQITDVFEDTLRNVAERDYNAEGFNSAEAFEHTWWRLHPDGGYQGDQVVWVHRFVKLGVEQESKT